MKRFFWILMLMLGGVAEAKPIKWGGRGWVVAIDGDEKVLDAMRLNWYLPWCFESVRGKMALKKLDVHLVLVDGGSRVGAEGVATAPEDHDILLCLDAAWKEMRPELPLGQYGLRFTFTKMRR